MKVISKIFIIILLVGSGFVSQSLYAQTPGRSPDIAFDTTNNRYLSVFEQDSGSGTDIFAQFRNPDSTTVAGSPVKISVARPTQGCFYGDFDSQNGDVTTPTNCTQNKNPAVAYSNGQYIVVWEVHGTANAGSTDADKNFVNIFARILDAGTLNPLPGWEEGILISKVFVAANNAESQCGDRHACNDGQIQAWSQSINPEVAPRTGAGGFVVTWQTNKDFIGCADPTRRQAWAVYGRYVDQSFSAASTTNPPMFAVYKDDSTMDDKCQPQNNVDNGVNPRIAFNQMANDFVVAYEVIKASGGNTSIGAKQVTLNTSNVGQVTGNIMPNIVATLDGGSLRLGDIISHKNNYYIFASDGVNIRGKSFSSSGISSTTPAIIDFGTGNKINPHAASNLGISGQRPGGTNTTPERLVVTYEQAGGIKAAVLDETLAITIPPLNLSTGLGAGNQFGDVASDLHDFVGIWDDHSSGDKVFAGFIDSEGTPGNNPPTAPVLDPQPADGVTWAPTRLFLSWAASTDPDAGDNITYDIYFAIGASPGASPYRSGVMDTHFVIQASTDNETQYNPDGGVTPIFLAPNQNYAWKICAKDNHGASNCSPTRIFHTDNSVLGWWRFDENPSGVICSGGGVGETVCDYSGNNNHGVPNGSPTWLPPPMASVLGGALNFDGVDDYIDIQNNSILSFGVGASIAIEYKLNGTTFASDPSEPFIISKGSVVPHHGNYTMYVVSATNKPTFSYTDLSDSTRLPTYTSNQVLPAATWSHLICTYTFGNAVSMKVQVNGILGGGGWANADGTPTATGNEAPLINSSSLSLARRTGNSSNHLNGKLDEVIIYNSYLSNAFMKNESQTSSP